MEKVDSPIPLGRMRCGFGIAKLPLGSLKFRIASATGLILEPSARQQHRHSRQIDLQKGVQGLPRTGHWSAQEEMYSPASSLRHHPAEWWPGTMRRRTSCPFEWVRRALRRTDFVSAPASPGRSPLRRNHWRSMHRSGRIPTAFHESYWDQSGSRNPRSHRRFCHRPRHTFPFAL